jgi:branched-subunit amino acid aminotransferase/4-amino-4-deoxychorismate lyase
VSLDLIYNGEFFPVDKPIIKASNRSFRYGDGLFESIRALDGEVYNFENHFARLIEGMKACHMEIPENFTIDFFKNQISSLLQRNGIREGGRVKLTVFREGEAPSYFPETNEPGFVIETLEYPDNKFVLNPEGLEVDLYNNMPKTVNDYSVFKSTNSFFYVNAIMYARYNDLKDCLLVNSRGAIIESTNSNLFIVSNGVLYTPPLTDGCVGGTMRMKIINLALESGIKVYEASISPQHLLSCDEIILSNAIQGVKWVSSYRTKRFFHKISDKLIELLNEDFKATH